MWGAIRKPNNNLINEQSHQQELSKLVHPQKSNKGTLNTYSDKSSLLHRYFWEIQQYDLLTEEEKRALAIRFQKYGDREAAHRLVLSHLRLVVKIAFQFQGIWTNTFLDLIQEGNFGLVKAADKYDPSKNVKFSYFMDKSLYAQVCYGTHAAGENRNIAKATKTFL